MTRSVKQYWRLVRLPFKNSRGTLKFSENNLSQFMVMCFVTLFVRKAMAEFNPECCLLGGVLWPNKHDVVITFYSGFSTYYPNDRLFFLSLVCGICQGCQRSNLLKQYQISMMSIFLLCPLVPRQSLWCWVLKLCTWTNMCKHPLTFGRGGLKLGWREAIRRRHATPRQWDEISSWH